MMRSKSILFSLSCSCWKQTIRNFPAVLRTKFCRFSAVSMAKSVPTTTCQIGPSSSMRRLRRDCAITCTSFEDVSATSFLIAAMVCATSEPSSTDLGSSTLTVPRPAGLLAAGSASAASGSAVAPSVSAVGAFSAPEEGGPSRPGDCQMTTIALSTCQTPMVLSLFLQAKPSCVPTSTCQCGPKFLSRDAFKESANSPHRAAFERLVLASSFLTQRW
mmetsp:Transcript_32626/g.73952  ORF Transcript_32626/g.73952 Transcript_32626/m.73952 type:complete len:217 (-) Transcript_32626:190-840(-)